METTCTTSNMSRSIGNRVLLLFINYKIEYILVSFALQVQTMKVFTKLEVLHIQLLKIIFKNKISEVVLIIVDLFFVFFSLYCSFNSVNKVVHCIFMKMIIVYIESVRQWSCQWLI